jgi:oleate hydratase
LPISTYLRSEGVNFHFNAKVVDMRMTLDDNLKGDPTTVTEIVLREHEEERIVNVDPNDLTIVTIGSPNSGYQLGTNSDPPPYPSDPDDFTYGDWSLWFHLAQKTTQVRGSIKF